jgi:hypothetical protein
MNALERLDGITVHLDSAVDSKKELRSDLSHLDSMWGKAVETLVRKDTPVPIAYWTHATAMWRS